MKRIIILIFILIYVFSVKSQSRLRIESGGSIYFNFNSLTKYKNGLEYANWTKLTVFFYDTLADGTQSNVKWKLEAHATTDEIINDAGGDNLLLETIELFASSNNATATSPGIRPLGDEFSVILLLTNGEQTKPGVSDVYITYYCGKSKIVTNNLMGTKSGYYFVDIVLTLGPE